MPIPAQMREEMSNDPYYKKCCLNGKGHGDCEGRIEWHHVIIFKGRQLQEKFAIVPACQGHHRLAEPLREHFEREALNRATDEELEAISKAIDYKAKRDRLNNG